MDVLMPQLGETVAEGTVAAWHKQPGDTVAKNEVLLDVETDKAAVEVPAPMAGVLVSVLVPAGETVDVGTVLAVIGTEGPKDSPEGSSGEVSPASPAGTEPDADEPAGEASAAPGAAPAPPAGSAGASADSAPSVAPAGGSAEPVSTGVASEPSPAAPAAPPPVGSAGRSAESAPAGHASDRAGRRTAGRTTGDRSRGDRGGRSRLSPAVRRLLKEHGVDAAEVSGTGHGGRITRNDILAFVEQRATPASAPAAASAGAAPALPSAGSAPAAASAGDAPAAASAGAAGAAAAKSPARTAPAAAGEPRRVRFDRIRRVTAEHMVRSRATSAHVMQAVEVDFAGVDRVRSTLRDDWRSEHGFSLTWLPFIARATCQALRDYPHVNASVDGDGLVLHPAVHLCIAVNLNFEGLVAPAIRNADALTVPDLARAIHDIGARARAGRLEPDEYSGGTYTLSNNGSYGTLMTAAIINQPQVAILSVDAIRKRPVVVESTAGDAIAIRPVGVLAQSFDHRAIDGAYSAAFLQRLRERLEEKDWAEEF